MTDGGGDEAMASTLVIIVTAAGKFHRHYHHCHCIGLFVLLKLVLTFNSIEVLIHSNGYDNNMPKILVNHDLENIIWSFPSFANDIGI